MQGRRLPTPAVAASGAPTVCYHRKKTVVLGGGSQPQTTVPIAPAAYPTAEPATEFEMLPGVEASLYRQMAIRPPPPAAP